MEYQKITNLLGNTSDNVPRFIIYYLLFITIMSLQ